MRCSASCNVPARASFMAMRQCSGKAVISRYSCTLRKYFQLRDNSNRAVWFLKCFSNGRLCQQKGVKHMLKNQLAAFTVATALMSFTAFAQEDYTRFKSDASVQALGSFVKQTTQDGID